MSYKACGRAQISARAECYVDSAFCVSETLSFDRPAGRAIVPLHTHQAVYDVQERRLKALDYRATAWACMPGRNGGHYLMVLMAPVATCTRCDYARLYDLRGNLVAAEAVLDTRGIARPDASGRRLIATLLADPNAPTFTELYR